MNSDLSYCYLCRAYHDDEESRCAWFKVKRGVVGAVKIFWYGTMALGNVLGAIVLLGWTILFLGLAYYFLLFLAHQAFGR